MKSIRLFSALTGFAFASLGLSTEAAKSGIGEGVFVLSLDESDLGDMPPPRHKVIDITVNTPSAIAFTVDVVLADGEKRHEAWEGAPDGMLRPRKNGRHGEQDAFRWIGRILVADDRLDDGTKLHEEISFSEDGNTMTIGKIVQSAKGEGPLISAVFRRWG
ncbi:MAG TPA: hypothetical protein VM689_00410 [Aliidongia sp.]|nr:hypothetical protein [Aliidongia sp.]